MKGWIGTAVGALAGASLLGLVLAGMSPHEERLVPEHQGTQAVGGWQFEQTAKVNKAGYYVLTVRAENHIAGPWQMMLEDVQPFLLDDSGDALAVADCSWDLPVVLDGIADVTLTCFTGVSEDEGFRSVRYGVRAFETRRLTSWALDGDT